MSASTPLRILVVEDSEDDAELVVRELRRGGYEVSAERVESAGALTAALRRQPWDVVVSDYILPGFGGLEALAIVQESGLDVPFIVVSGTIGDERAAELMKAGAHDYVLKHNLPRLAPAIARELRDARTRLRERRAEEQLRRSESMNRLLAHAAELLHSPLEHDGALSALARLVVPELGDWVVIDLVEDDGSVRQAVVAHRDPAKEALVRELREVGADDPLAGAAAARIIREGEPALIEVLRPRAGDPGLPPEHRRLLRELTPRSYLGVPLRVRGRTLGALSFVAAESGRRYRASDLDFASEIARRVAVTIDNQHLYQEAQRAVRARDELMWLAAHELRTPVTAVLLHLHVLRGELESAGREDLAMRVDRSEKQIRRLVRLVEGVLDVSRISADRLVLELSRFDVAEVVHEVAAALAGEAEAAGCELRVCTPQRAEGCWDRLRVEQAIGNVVDNAIKYGRGHPVEISVVKEAERVILIVEDHGIGISPEDLGRIFEPFERAAPMRQYPGIGLGLFIARQIVAAHGGSIRATSQLARGSTFRIALPRTR